MKQHFMLLLLISISFFSYSQNVGIGVSDPKEKLDIAGAVKVGYSNSSYSPGALRYDGEIEFNNGFGWRTLVNSFKDSALSAVTPFYSTSRNTYVQVPGVSMTISTAGTYLVIFKVNGSNNNAYFPSGGNYDQGGIASFRIGGEQVASRNFIRLDVSGQDNFTRFDFYPNPTEYSCIRQISSPTVMTIWANMMSTGSVPGTWTINEAEIISVRLF